MFDYSWWAQIKLNQWSCETFKSQAQVCYKQNRIQNFWWSVLCQILIKQVVSCWKPQDSKKWYLRDLPGSEQLFIGVRDHLGLTSLNEQFETILCGMRTVMVSQAAHQEPDKHYPSIQNPFTVSKWQGVLVHVLGNQTTQTIGVNYFWSSTMDYNDQHDHCKTRSG